MGDTYYDVLGVDPDASCAEIRDAYRDRVLETHPDHNDDPDATEQFQRVSTAESVLSDGTERARYDRLGHDAYVRLANQTAGGSDNTDTRSTGSTSTETQPGEGGFTNATNESATDRQTNERTGQRRTSTRSERTHTRKRYWQRSANERGSTDGWSSASTDRTAGETDRSNTNTDADESESGFQYVVQDWDDEIELEEDRRSIDHSTAVTLGCVWLLYPLFLYATLTPLFSSIVNVILGICTLGLVGYLLMIPRVATAIFGFWSLFLPAGIVRLSIVDPLSLRGLLAISFVWIPFGYAVVLWWALRP